MNGFIYCIKNLINGKLYIGKTTKTIESRWKEHVHDSSRRDMENRPLYRAFNKYGIDNFEISLVEECEISLLSDREIYWISYYKSNVNGYNATYGGDGKILYDYNKIIEVYNLKKNIIHTANEIGCCVDTIRNVLVSAGIKIEIPIVGVCNERKCVAAYDKNGEFVKSFNSIAEAGHWVVDNNKAKTYNSGIRGHISDCANGKTKMAYKYSWKFINSES